jgi:hypothetical protein
MPAPKPKPAKPTAAPASTRAGQGQAKPPAPPPTVAAGGIKVRATKVCYYDDKRRRIGDVFTIANETEFSSRYMERVHPRTPERITTGAQVLQQQHDEILAGKQIENNPELGKAHSGATGDEDALGEE